MVAMLQPNCRSVGRFTPLIQLNHYETWLEHFREDVPHMTYCGEVAKLQIQLNRFFLREQPAGSLIDSYVKPWTEVQANPEVITIHMDQCMAGQMADTGRPIQTHTEWTSTSKVLVLPLQQRFQCDKSHGHCTPNTT